MRPSARLLAVEIVAGEATTEEGHRLWIATGLLSIVLFGWAAAAQRRRFTW